MSEGNAKTSRCFRQWTSEPDGWVAVNAQRKQCMTKTAGSCYAFLLYSQTVRPWCQKQREKKKKPPSSCRGSSSLCNTIYHMWSCELNNSVGWAIQAVFQHCKPVWDNQGKHCNQWQNLPVRVCHIYKVITGHRVQTTDAVYWKMQPSDLFCQCQPEKQWKPHWICF